MEEHIPLYRKIFFSTTKYIIFKNVFIVATGVLSIFIVRFLGPKEYGKYFLVIQIVAAMGPMLSLGWLPALAKFLPEFDGVEQKKELFSVAAATIMLILLIFMLISTTASDALWGFIPKEIRDIRYIFIFLICTTALTNLSEGLYRGLGKFNNWALLEGTRSMIAALIILGLIIFLKNDYTSAITGSFAINTIFILILFFLTAGYLKAPAFSLKKDVLNFILIMIASQVLFLFISNVDPILLRWLLKDPAQVGYYSAGTRIQKLTEGLFFGHLAVPFLYYFSSAGSHEKRRKIIENTTRLLGVIFGLAALVMFSFSEQIVPLLFGKSFAGSIPVMRVYSFWLFFISLQVFVSPFFLAINKPHVLLIAGFMFFTFNLLFDLLLIPRFYAAGAALSAILTIFVLTFYYIYSFKKYEVNLFKDIIYLISGMAISAAAGMLTFYSVSIVVFAAYVLVTKLVTLKDIDKLKEIFARNEPVPYVPPVTGS